MGLVRMVISWYNKEGLISRYSGEVISPVLYTRLNDINGVIKNETGTDPEV